MSLKFKHGRVKKQIWRCSRYKCRGVLSIRAKNAFFVYKGPNRGRLPYRLPVHTILDVVYQWLFSNDKLKQASFHLGISEHSIVEWYHSCRTTVAKSNRR